MTDETPDQTPDETMPAKASGRYAAYNKTLLRFTGGVHPTRTDAGRSAAVKAAKDAGHDVTVQRV